MMVFFFPLLFFFGLFIGSFLGVISDRVPNNESIVLPPSHCDSCKKKLRWYDNIPLLSYVLLKGKCRFCGNKISFYYPAVELTTALLFVVIGISTQNITELIFNLYISASLIVIFFSDLKYEIIPSSVVYPAIVITFLFKIFFVNLTLFPPIASALGAFLFFLSLFLITKGRGMGFGDVQLAFLMGLFLGFPKILVSLYVAFLTGGMLSLILVLWGKKKLRGSTLPFGPFLVFGTFFALFFGNVLWNR